MLVVVGPTVSAFAVTDASKGARRRVAAKPDGEPLGRRGNPVLAGVHREGDVPAVTLIASG